MRKKIFAAVLAAAMTVTSAFSAFAGEDLEISDFASQKTTAQTVDANFEVTYTFHINAYKSGANTYENVMVEFFNEDGDTITNAQANYLSVVCNGGAWFWNGGSAEQQWTASDGTTDNGTLTCTNECTDTDMSILKDADMTLDIKKDGAKFTITGTVDGAAVWNFEVEGNDTFATAGGFLHLSGEKVDLTGVEYTNSNGAEVATPAPTEETTTPDLKSIIDNDTYKSTTETTTEESSDNTWIYIVVGVAVVVVVAGVIVAVAMKGKKKDGEEE
jgi:hypothetical protein